jgi:tetratricopeptide (TPR) repeat protein
MSLVAVLLLAFQATGDLTIEGTKAVEAQNYTLGIRLLTQALEKDPQDYYAQFNLALAYSGLGQDAQAIEGYRKTLVLKPQLYEADLNLGILLLQNQKPQDAIVVLAEAQFQKPSDFRPAYYLAQAQFAAAQFDKAEESYKIAVAANKMSAPAEYGIARAIAKQGRLDDAALHYSRAAELDPQYRDAPLELAEMYLQSKQPERAIELYKQFAQSPAAQERLGAMLLEQNNNEEAIAPLEFAVSKAPNAANRNALIEAYIKTKHPDKALPLVDQMLTANPKDADLFLLRGRIFRDQRNFKEAANSFYAATKLKPESVEAWNELSAMFISLENYSQALAALDKLKELKAETPPHFFFRAIILDKMKQPKPALEAYKRFLELAQGKFPDQEFQARQRVRIIERELNKR